METSNAVFSKYIADYSEKYAGVKSDDWSLCTVRNATYTACPVYEGLSEFAITSYNPSTLD